MRITFLGTGTSTGVPQIGCRCATCQSTDPRDRRLRASAIVETDTGNRVLIDCGPDFREQILRAGAPGLDCALLTHSHYDHVGGIDDLRPYSNGHDFDLYCRPDVARDLRSRVPYCFVEHPYPGVPTFSVHEVDAEKPFMVNGEEIIPLPVMHARLAIIGFRIGRLAYITDCKTMPETTLEKIRGVDVLVINALRHEEHMSHLNLEQALDVIKSAGPKRAYLTHLSHQMGLQAETEPTLPGNVRIAYDGLTITL